MKLLKTNLLIFAFVIVLLLLSGSRVTATSPSSASSSLPNPIGPTNMTIVNVFIGVLRVALGVISLVALSMFIYGGLVMLTSGGNPEKVKKAKDTLVWAILGLATILFSGAIVQYIFENFRF